MTNPREDVRCSQAARRAALDPIGTAGSYDGIVLAELPLPWPRDVADVTELAEAHQRARDAFGGRWRLQAVTPRPAESRETAARPRRYQLYRRPPGPFAGFAPVDPPGPAAPVDTPGPAAPVGATTGRVVLLCTHGTRDRCCGSLGAALFVELPPLPGVAVARTSHTGGHRFAPTAMILPEGTGWAYLDPDLLAGVVARTAPVEVAARHYRGCFGLDSPELQVADREALLRYGWEWLDTPRSGSVVARDADSVGVRIEAPGVVHDVELKAHLSEPVVGSCGQPFESAARPEPQWKIMSFT